MFSTYCRQSDNAGEVHLSIGALPSYYYKIMGALSMCDKTSVNPVRGYWAQYQLRRNEGERDIGFNSYDARK